METSHLKNYFRGFIKQLKNEYENVSKASSDSNNSNSTHIGAGQMVNSEASEDIKIALYRYIKLLYDRWLSGNPQNNWDVKNFFLHWHFIDAYYNVIGDIVYVNIINDFFINLYRKEIENCLKAGKTENNETICIVCDKNYIPDLNNKKCIKYIKENN